MNKFKTLLSIIAIAVCALVFAGCTQFVNTIIPIEKAKVDKELLGKWTQTDSAWVDATSGSAEFIANDKNTMVANQDVNGSVTKYVFIPAKLDKHKYMNIYASSGGGLYIYRYTIVKEKGQNHLTVWALSDTTINHATSAGLLSKTTDYNGEVRITATTDELQKWLATLDDNLDWTVSYYYRKN